MIAEVLEAAARKGVRIWAEQGELHFQAPKGALTTQDLSKLRLLKPQIITYLETSAPDSGPDVPLQPRRGHEALPLTFPQAVHWRVYQLREVPAIRHLAVAFRLQGVLDVTLLERCIERLQQRHEALRIRIGMRDGQPFQIVDPPGRFQLSQIDLSREPDATRDETVTTLVARFVTQTISVTEQALFDARLFKLGGADHVLVLATEHLISDAQSMSILVGDLFELYSRAARGDETELAQLPIQFPDYVAWQMQQLPIWQKRHGAYWRDRLAGAARVRFPRSEVGSPTMRSGWGNVEVRVDTELRERLLRWCRSQHATLVMTVFAAYAATVMEWCKVDNAVFRFQTTGRWDRQLQAAVGYFATVLPLRLQAQAGDRFVDLVQRAMTEYASASEHADLSYIDAQSPRPEFAVNPAFNWVPATPRCPQLADLPPDRAISVTELPIRREAFSRFGDDHEPVFLCFERGAVIDAALHYPRKCFDASTMQAFADAFRQRLLVLQE